MKILSLLLAILLWFAAPVLSFAETKIRVGHFPNITHAQALVAHALSRQGKGWFEQRLGPGTKIEWFIYNAGPSAMEGIFAKSIDLTYVGPGPALNAYTKSNGQEIRLIAGAANGGAGFIVQPDENLKAPADFRGKKIATPQLGNTQDISCRAWLIDGGLKITQLGGDAYVIPTQNPDQLSLFKAKRIDAVWTVEPWLTRLEQEASGKVIVEEKEVATTILVSSVKFLNQQHELAKSFAQAHAELTDWITKNPEEAQRLIKAELLEETKSDMSTQLIDAAWKRIVFTAETPRAAVEKFMQNSVRAGFIKTAPDRARVGRCVARSRGRRIHRHRRAEWLRKIDAARYHRRFGKTGQRTSAGRQSTGDRARAAPTGHVSGIRAISVAEYVRQRHVRFEVETRFTEPGT